MSSTTNPSHIAEQVQIQQSNGWQMMLLMMAR
jgi:hypothetical protein